jgi:hypothetical protein
MNEKEYLNVQCYDAKEGAFLMNNDDDNYEDNNFYRKGKLVIAILFGLSLIGFIAYLLYNHFRKKATVTTTSRSGNNNNHIELQNMDDPHDHSSSSSTRKTRRLEEDQEEYTVHFSPMIIPNAEDDQADDNYGTV